MDAELDTPLSLPGPRGLFPLELTPGLISLLAGKPNPSTFPITSLSFTARTPNPDGTDTEQQYTLEGKALTAALQYGPTAGPPELVKWLLGLQERVHERPVSDDEWSLTCGAGGQDLLYKVGNLYAYSEGMNDVAV